MRERFERRIEKGLEAIARGCGRRKFEPGVVERRVGRLLGLNSRAARLYTVDVTRDGLARIRTYRDVSPALSRAFAE